ncbi:methionine gamma-lyase [Actinidia rufa]|uniref:Methionine gamma-lyase n=1 Tax=Actinidia rufa TaxID=165716 RepID=A0A7J0DWZ0_9ERIC|nr:methionine gamma-lyase [Actinidia rufa]
MAETGFHNVVLSGKKRGGSDDADRNDYMVAKKALATMPPSWEDPVAALANSRHEFGEHGGVNMSIEASATFTVMEPETMRRMFDGELGPDRDFFIYSRHFNPTVLNLGRQMAALEGTEAAYCTASGMSAVSSVLLQLVSSGGHVVASRSLYGGTHALLTHFFPRACNITTTFVDLRDLDMVRDAIVEGRTKVLYFEAVSNPTLSVANVPELCRIAHDKGAMVVVDNTFSPHDGDFAGSARRRRGCSQHIEVHQWWGRHHCRCCMWASKPCELHDGPPPRGPDAARPNYECQVSLGYHETLMSCSGSSTSSELNAEEKALAGISPGLVRMSVGYSGTLEQRWSQFEKTLTRMQDSSLFPKN